MLSGCGLTLGPRVATTYLIVEPGKPLVCLSNTTVTGRRLDAPEDSPPVKQAIGGWIVMPESHFAALMRAAQK